AQQLWAPHRKAEVGTGLEQRTQLWRRFDNLFEVVQQEKQLPLPDVLGQAVLRPQGLRDGPDDEGRIAQGSKPDPEDPVPELRNQLGRRLDRRSRLPGAAWAGQGHQPSAVLQQLHHVRHLPFTAHERGRPKASATTRPRKPLALNCDATSLQANASSRTDTKRPKNRSDHHSAAPDG